MNDSISDSDLNSQPAAKRRRLDEMVQQATVDETMTNVLSVDHSSYLVVDTFLNHIVKADKLLFANLFMENLESFLRDCNCNVNHQQQQLDGPNVKQFVNTFLRLGGCGIILHSLKRWVQAGTNEIGTIDEETAAFVSTTLGFLLQMMEHNRKTVSSILDVKSLHITPILVEICKKVPYDTAILTRSIAIWANLMTNVSRRTDVLVENISSLILNIMLLHPQCERIQRSGCKFFASLATMSNRETQQQQHFDRSKLQSVIQQSLVQYRLKERTIYWVRQCTSLYSVGNLVSDAEGDDSDDDNDDNDNVHSSFGL